MASRFPNHPSFRYPFIALLAFMAIFQWQCLKPKKQGIPLDVQKVIRHSGLNKPELMKAIGKYLDQHDTLRLAALYNLLAQMDKNYTVYYSVQDSLGNHYSFYPENYNNYYSLKHAWDSTEQIHGNLIYHADSFRVDDQTLSGKFLIQNLDNAFLSWKKFPWSKNYSFQTFYRWILPYRVANEPVENFRNHFLSEYGPIPDSFFRKKSHVIDIALYLNHLINQKIDFKETYNKSLNVQSIHQLENSGKGNFYDINIYKVKVLRSFGIAAAMDYSPFLADTNFGYAYTSVILPDHSELILEFPHRVKNLHKPGRIAKIYRRTFYQDSVSLYTIKNIKTATPPFMGDFYYEDVTNNLSSSPVWLHLSDTSLYAYLSVFNDGGWRPVSWSYNRDSSAFFNKMGKNIIYLPTGFRNHHLIRLGNPFLLNNRGIKIYLKANFSVQQKVTLSKVNPWQKITPGENYTLYFWDGNWKTLVSFTAGRIPPSFLLPANGLFFLTNDDINFNERIFIINSLGEQQFY